MLSMYVHRWYANENVGSKEKWHKNSTKLKKKKVFKKKIIIIIIK